MVKEDFWDYISGKKEYERHFNYQNTLSPSIHQHRDFLSKLAAMSVKIESHWSHWETELSLIIPPSHAEHLMDISNPYPLNQVNQALEDIMEDKLRCYGNGICS